MTKKYYAWFIYDDEEYVIRMKIRGSLQWDKNHHCFMDKDWYVRGIEDIVVMSAYIPTGPMISGWVFVSS